ncbi:MAG: hypothetical protein ACREON_18250 [Gemmatimonadaceae bacterium]
MMIPRISFALLLALSCGTPAEPRREVDDSPVVFSRQFAGGLTQTITLSSGEVRPGGVLKIRSVLENTTPQSIDVVSHICGLAVWTAMPLETDQRVRCAGYSTGGAMQPGERRDESEWLVVGDGDGRYSIAVRHALSPELWMVVDVVVRR